MNQSLSPWWARPRRWLSADGAGVERRRQLLQAAATRPWWVAAVVVLVVGGGAAGLHAPTSGVDFWHLANAELIWRHGLAGAARYLARPGAPLDLRSWLADLLLLLFYRVGGLGGLQVVGAVGGAVVGLALLAAIRFDGRAQPLAIVIAGGLGMLALAPVLTDLPAEVLALLAAVLLLALALVSRRGRWGAAMLVGLVVVWTNIQADAFLAVLVIWGWVAIAHWDAARPGGPVAPSWWLIPLTGLAVLLSPRGIGTITELPLSLGMRGESPLLVAWSSIDFHPWSARLAELAGLLLLFSYWVAGARLRRADAYLGLVTATMALLWTNYLPWFLVVAAAQSSWYLSEALLTRAGGAVARRPEQGRPFGQRIRAASAVPIGLAIVLLAYGVFAPGRDGGVEARTSAQLPVQATAWLKAHPVGGAWFTTPNFGDYLSARFPSGGHLLCVDDPLPLAGAPLDQCQELTVLNAGAMGIVRSLGTRLAVLPRSAASATFLLAQGWEIRYRDATTVILAPRHL
ncbi:MAG: hypothetical protein WB867_07160 [Candidatus Dormiibacterota bacterium]